MTSPVLSRLRPPMEDSSMSRLRSPAVAAYFVLAPVALLLVAGATRLLPQARRGPTIVGLVPGATTLPAVPLLGRYGARVDNPTLLDRVHTVGRLVLAGPVVLAVVVAGRLAQRQSRGSAAEGSARGTRARGR